MIQALVKTKSESVVYESNVIRLTLISPTLSRCDTNQHDELGSWTLDWSPRIISSPRSFPQSPFTTTNCHSSRNWPWFELISGQFWELITDCSRLLLHPSLLSTLTTHHFTLVRDLHTSLGSTLLFLLAVHILVIASSQGFCCIFSSSLWYNMNELPVYRLITSWGGWRQISEHCLCQRDNKILGQVFQIITCCGGGRHISEHCLCQRNTRLLGPMHPIDEIYVFSLLMNWLCILCTHKPLFIICYHLFLDELWCWFKLELFYSSC